MGLAGYCLPLLIGLLGMPEAFLGALLLCIAQSAFFFSRERTFKAFSVQLRLAYLLLLIICFFSPTRWLYWLPVVGTFALVIFGYCLMARMLSLLPWNRTEAITADLLRRTFLSRPKLVDQVDSVSSTGCAAGLCSIEAQVGSITDRTKKLQADCIKHSKSLSPDRANWLIPCGQPRGFPISDPDPGWLVTLNHSLSRKVLIERI